MKKFFCFIISIALCFSLTMPVSASVYQEFTTDNITGTDKKAAFAEDGVIYKTLNILYQSPESFGIKNEQIKEASIGLEFTIMQYNDDGTLTNNHQIFYYPIVCDNSVIAIITLMKYQGNLSCTIGIDFAPTLNSMLYENPESHFLLYSSSNGIYALSDNGQTITIHNDTSLNQAQISDISRNSLQQHIEQTISLDLTETKYSVAALCNTKTTRWSALYFLENYPCVTQEGDNCWAASLASILRYELPVQYGTYMGQDICNDMGMGLVGANWTQVMTAFNLYFSSPYVPTLIDGTASIAQMSYFYSNNDPAYMGCVRTDASTGSVAHHVAWCGYGYNDTSYFIRYMNPGYGSLAIAYSEGDTYTFTYIGSIWFWEKTVYFEYT